MISLARRVRIGWWALRNAERLLALHFDMLRDEQVCSTRGDNEGPRAPGNYWHGREAGARMYAHRLRDMPGADANRAAL